MLFSLKAFVFHPRVVKRHSLTRLAVTADFPPRFLHESHESLVAVFLPISLVSKCRVPFTQPNKFKGLGMGAPS